MLSWVGAMCDAALTAGRHGHLNHSCTVSFAIYLTHAFHRLTSAGAVLLLCILHRHQPRVSANALGVFTGAVLLLCILQLREQQRKINVLQTLLADSLGEEVEEGEEDEEEDDDEVVYDSAKDKEAQVSVAKALKR